MKKSYQIAILAVLAGIFALVLSVSALLERQTEPPRDTTPATSEPTIPTQNTENLTPWG